MDKTKDHIKQNTYIKKILTLDEYQQYYHYPENPANFLEHNNYLKSKIDYCKHVSYTAKISNHYKHTTYTWESISTNNPEEVYGMTIQNQMVDINEIKTEEIK